MRVPLIGLTMSSILALGGCTDVPAFGPNGPVRPPAAANPDHPRAEALLVRETRPVPAREPARDAGRDANATLRDGIRLYNNGDFANAITKLSAPEIQSASTGTRTSALKYIAFSYCVTQRPVQCRQSFDKALRIDASFALAPGEEGHPMWGPVFDQARAGRKE